VTCSRAAIPGEATNRNSDLAARRRPKKPRALPWRVLTLVRTLESAALAVACLGLGGCASGVYKVPGSAQKVCQLTGEIDAGVLPPVQTTNATETRAKLRGTDLGISVPGPFGSIFFFFGDSMPTRDISRPVGADSVAYTTTSDDPNDCLHLTFFLRPDRGYLPPALLDHPAGPYIRLGNWEVPTGGFFWNGNAYVTFQIEAKDDGDGYRPHRSVMGRASGLIYDDPTFTRLYDFDPDRFLNVASVLVGDDGFLPRRLPMCCISAPDAIAKRTTSTLPKPSWAASTLATGPTLPGSTRPAIPYGAEIRRLPSVFFPRRMRRAWGSCRSRGIPTSANG
jgi:hypothetical protein